MPQLELTIINKLGLHARAAAKLVNLVRCYQAQVHLEVNGRKARGDSIMGLMTLCATKGTGVRVCAEGDDADQALEAISGLLANRFDEPE